MAVKFESLYDQLRTTIAGLTGFTTKAELPNPYDVPDNPEGMLRDGWGLTILDAVEGPGEYNSSTDLQSFGVVLTKEVPRTDNNPEPLVTAIKALKADVITLKQGLMPLNVHNEAMLYTGTSSVDTLTNERTKIITITVGFTAYIREAI
jgi:hypothetical protein